VAAPTERTRPEGLGELQLGQLVHAAACLLLLLLRMLLEEERALLACSTEPVCKRCSQRMEELSVWRPAALLFGGGVAGCM
jgi:hypothetical protein